MKISKSLMNFAESVVDSLEAVSEKIDEVQAKMDELQNTIDGNGSSNADEPEVTEETVEEVAVEDKPSEEKEEKPEDVKEDFSEKYMVVKNLVAPFGNTVIKATDFSEKKHQKIFNKTFSTVMQAQRMMSLYSTEGKNFSYRYKDVKNMLTL